MAEFKDENVLIVDSNKVVFDHALSTDTTANGIIVETTVDANTVGFGCALHIDADGNFIEADATADTTMPCSALALETGTGTKNVFLTGYIRDDSWSWTPGGLVYVSETSGTLTQTAPTTSAAQVQVVGVAKSADIIHFVPHFILAEVA